MAQFELNGNMVSTEADKSLLRFLRDDMRIKSVKEGCAEGACGTCSVLVDGKSRRACVLRVQKIDGCRVTTLEGLSEYEREVYAHCFAQAGAVQCGFCIPGMVISAKALLDVNLSPTEDEIAGALRGNICRCTGYKKIIEAVLNAAAFFRENKQVPQGVCETAAGDVLRPCAKDKTLGLGEYVDDMEVDGLVYASALRSEYPRAIVKKIDTSKAAAHPAAIAVITAEDVPGSNKAGHIVKDWDVLIAQGDTTHYLGDAVALVVSENADALDEIKSLIEVTYEPLAPVISPQQALADGAPQLHKGGNVLRHDRVKRGAPVDEVLANSAHVASHTYTLPFTEHAYMEPECAVCVPSGEGLTLYTSGQNIYDEQREIAHILGIGADQVHVVSKLVGGAFGGKEDMTVQHHAALAAYITKRPVKVKLSRKESLVVSTKRHAMTIEMTTGCDESGRLTAAKARIISDTGAYASLGGPVVQRAVTHAAGPYAYDSVDIEGRAVYTNNMPGGAFRGFGVTQSCFATESNLSELAKMVGISPWEIRYKNAVRPGGTLPNGQIADKTTALAECLEALKETYEAHPDAGIACALKNTGLGVGVPDTGRCVVSVENGRLHIRTGAARVGQGLDCVILRMAAQTLGLPRETLVIEAPNTQRTPNSGTTTASRQTMFTGHAVVDACRQVKKLLDAGETLESLEGREFHGEFTCVTDPITTDKAHPFSHAAYTYGAQVVALNGDGCVDEVFAAYDVGQLIHRVNAEGQVEGGIVMGLGYALTEDFPLDQCVPQAKLGTLGLWRAADMPKMHVQFVCREYCSDIALGAKGLGEIATIPTAPAAAGAYYNKDGVLRTKLPLENTPYTK